MIPTKKETEIWVHVTPNDIVWFGTDQHPAVESGLNARQFAEQDWVLNGQCIRIVGDWENAELITRLWNAKIKDGLPLRIYLCCKHRHRPVAQTQIQQMRNINIPPSCGGWHQMTAADYPSYGLISAMLKSQHQMSDLIMQLLRAHPAWLAISFVPSIDYHWAATMLSYLVDPRWYVDSLRPDSSTWYYSALALGSSNMSKPWAWLAYLRQPFQPEAEYNKIALTVEPWAKPGILESADLSVPENFLVRIVKQHEGGLPSGMLAACRVFSRFVRDVWLDRLTPARRYESRVSKPNEPTSSRLLPSRSYAPQLFVPQHFFRESATIVKWYDHEAGIVGS